MDAVEHDMPKSEVTWWVNIIASRCSAPIEAMSIVVDEGINR